MPKVVAVATSLLARGPVARGPVARGPVARGPVARGLVARGLAAPASPKRLVYKPPCGPIPQGGFVLNNEARLSGGLLLFHEWSVAQLLHGRGRLIAAFQLKHHPFDVLVVGMRLEE